MQATKLKNISIEEYIAIERENDTRYEIETLREYILIEQEKPQIDIYTRNEGDLWRINRVSGLENSLTLQSLDIEIPLAAIYRNVDFVVSQ